MRIISAWIGSLVGVLILASLVRGAGLWNVLIGIGLFVLVIVLGLVLLVIVARLTQPSYCKSANPFRVHQFYSQWGDPSCEL